MFSVIIAGGRTFNDYPLLKQKCDIILKDKTDIEIVSGGAKGADHLGELYAAGQGYRIKRFPALWDKIDIKPCKIKYNKFKQPYNTLAGLNRNLLMGKYADALIAFYNGSSGTKNMIGIAEKLNLLIRIIRYV